MIRLFLNLAHRETFTIFDIQTGTRFNGETPFRTVPFVSEPLKRSIRAGKIIDIDNVLGIELRPGIVNVHDRVLALAGITRQIDDSDTAKDAPIKNSTPKEEHAADVEHETKPKSKKASSKAKEEKEAKESEK